ncbi:hypothetical protein V8E36_003108 [Tilletia maclaganii]
MIAPYNNAMRLGQGFNSYTQQICVDNAVIVNPERTENILTNDGATMRILAQKLKKASIWRSMPEYIADGKMSTQDTEPVDDGSTPADDNRSNKIPIGVAESETPAQGSDSSRPVDELNQEQVNAGLESEAAKQEAANKKLMAQVEASIDAKRQMAKDIVKSDQALADMTKKDEDKLNSRGTGMAVNARKFYPWTKAKSVGMSQIVSYRSKFVDKLSEINDEMSGSAALSIQTDVLGGSGRGAFIDSSKFYGSDVKFFLSVKVINQSINFKDALEFNPIPSIRLNDTRKFTECFGDSFISGFLEGGELNAVVLMKIHNNAKKEHIMAEAKVALTKGAELDGQGNIALAKKNIEMNTEITIYVQWSGGASLKHYDEQWSIDSLLAAANRFPYLASQYPQRTYAILTKYESLRSYVKLKPAKVSPLSYENAAVYTGTLLDAYLEYSALAKKVNADIQTVQAGVKRFKEAAPQTSEQDPEAKKIEPSRALKEFKLLSKFDSNLEGLDAARKVIRDMMNRIVREVDTITYSPEVATQDRGILFVGPASFQTLLPEVEYKVRKVRKQALSGKPINSPVTDVNKAKLLESGNTEAHLFDQSTSDLPLSETEKIKLASIERADSELAGTTRVTPPIGSLSAGEMFCTLDIGMQYPLLSSVSVGRQDNIVRALSVTYSNGFTIEFGDEISKYKPFDGDLKSLPAGTKVRSILSGLNESEQITSATIEVDADKDLALSVIGVRFVTNQGQFLDALVDENGFFGRAVNVDDEDLVDDEAARAKDELDARITRLGLVLTQAIVKDDVFDADMPAPCIVGTRLLEKADNQEPISIGRKFVGLPQVICGMRKLQYWQRPGLSCRAFLVPQAGRSDQIVFAAFTDASVHAIGYGWMVLPELDDVHIQCGSLTLENKGFEVTKEISFEIGFADGTVPSVVCWIEGLVLTDGTTSIDVKTGVVAGSVKASGFDVKITDSQGNLRAGTDPKRAITVKDVRIGWLAHDHMPKESEARFQSAEISLSIGNDGGDRLPTDYPLNFQGKPTKHFTAFSAIKADNPGDANTQLLDSAVVSASPSRFTPRILAPPNSTISAVFVSSLQVALLRR